MIRFSLQPVCVLFAEIVGDSFERRRRKIGIGTLVMALEFTVGFPPTKMIRGRLLFNVFPIVSEASIRTGNRRPRDLSRLPCLLGNRCSSRVRYL